MAFSLGAVYSLAQPGNLVENPSFEFRPECDDNNGPLEEAPPWFNPTGASPDVFHECAVQIEDACPFPDEVNLNPWLFGVPTNVLGCQEPVSGAGYGGLYTYGPNVLGFDFREYLAVPLSKTMVAGETYLVRFYVSLADRALYAIHALQVLFSADVILEESSLGVLNYSPALSHTAGDYITDKDTWTELSWEYTAVGTENYMYIGNFQPNSDIDTLFVLPDSINTLWYFDDAYYYVDDVYVGTEALTVLERNNQFSLEIRPNPASEALTISSDIQIHKLSVYSVDGKLIHHDSNRWVGKRNLDINAFAAGIYILSVSAEKGNIANQKFVKR